MNVANFAQSPEIERYTGIVVDNNDPIKKGRLKVRIELLFDSIPTDDLPWVYPSSNLFLGSGNGKLIFSVPELDSKVFVEFNSTDYYSGVYYGEPLVSTDIPPEFLVDYPNTYGMVDPDGISVVANKVTKTVDITFVNGTSIKFDGNNDVIMNITGNLSVTTSKDVTVKSATQVIVDSSKIYLGAGATEKLVLGNVFKDFLNSFFSSKFDTHFHLGNLGLPTLPTDSGFIGEQMSDSELSADNTFTK